MQKLNIERLEERMLLANLTLTDAFLIDGNLNRQDIPVLGEMLAIRANWSTEDLPNDAEYQVQYLVDGVELRSANVSSGAGFSSGNYYWRRSGWYASPGEHTVEINIDPDDLVEETNENDNSFTFTFTPESGTPPAKMIWPTVAEPYTELGLTNYVDVDPTSGVADYTGGNAAYDGHSAIDAGVVDFRAMDKGSGIVAALDGTVIDIHDGEYDRHTSWGSPSPNANYVILDHGDGWTTRYWHLRKDSVAVQIGDTVSAGDFLGLMGSSGRSTGVHIHFNIFRHNRPIETFFDAETYWVDPIDYVGDQVHFLDSGVSNYDINDHLKEGPSQALHFNQDSGQVTYVWARFNGLRESDLVEYVWRRPNGNIYTTGSFNVPQDYSNSVWYFSRTLPTTPDAGTWVVEFNVEGTKLGEQEFFVSAAGEPEARVEDAANGIILDERFTPVDFGISNASSGSQKSFKLINHGSSQLSIDSIQLPAGFNLIDGLPSSLEPGQSDWFTIEVDNSSAGYYMGQVEIFTNDSDEARYNFPVESTIVDAALDTLKIGFLSRKLTEADTIFGKVYRDGPIGSALDVSLSTDNQEISIPAAIQIPAGESFVSFPVSGVNDFMKDGIQSVSVVATATSYADATGAIDVAEIPPVIVNGSSGDDTIIVSKTNTGYNINVNGSVSSIAEEDVYELVVDGLGGVDEVRFNLGDEDVSGTLGTDASRVSSDRYIFKTDNAERVRVNAGSGENSIVLNGSNSNDRLVANQDSATLTGGGLFKSVSGFDSIVATGENGNDQAILNGTSGNEKLFANRTSSLLTGVGFETRALAFENVVANALDGNDIAQVYDTPNDDTFTGDSEKGIISGNNYRVESVGFDRIIVRSTNGGTDSAILTGSSLDERFAGRQTFGLLKAVDGSYLLRVIGFDSVQADGNGGNDIANLFDSAGDDVFRGDATKSFLRGIDFNNTALDFDRVNAKATTGDDVATLIDGSGNDRFLGQGKKGILTGQNNSFLNYTIGFDTVRADAANGGIDDLNVKPNITYTFVELGDWET